MEYRGYLYAILAAVSAALVGIFAKLGMRQLDTNLATALRSIVMMLFCVAVVTWMGLWHKLEHVGPRAVVMIVLAGVAGATSWLFGFKAIELIGVAKTAPLDKLSVPLAVVLAYFLLGERPTSVNWLGVGLIAVGAYLAAVNWKWG